MMWQIVLSLVCVAFLGAILWEKRQGKLMQSASDRKLENVNCLFDAILTHIHAYVLVIDSDFKVLKTNYYDLTHLSPDGKEKRVGDLLQCRNALSAKGGCGTHAFCQECPVRGAIGNAFRQKKEFTDLQSSLNIAIDEHEFVKCDVMISGVFMTLDSEECMVLTVHDITSIKQTEEALAEAKEKAENADRSKSAFLANMSHEIRTPLNAIVGFSELLAAANTEEEKQKYLEILHTNSELLLQLVNDILDLSKIEAGTLEFVYSDVDINLLLNDLEQLFRMKIGSNSPVQIITEPGLPSCMVHTDRNRIAQVVSNFVSNAIKFTTEGSIRIGYQSSENGLRFYVSDTGSGISADKLEGVFDRFVRLQSDKNGNGLGLSICKTIVNKLGGEIGAESEVGKGSTFWFTLPEHSDIKPKVIIEKEQEELPSAVRVPVIDAGSDKKLSILVAEDMEDNYRLCEAILASRYELHWAHNGEEAISLFLKFQPDIILMDIRMPEVNGYEATEAIRQMSATVPIIALTAFAYEEDRQKIMHSGFTDFLTKPISSKVLLGKLESLKKI
ncbi:response regulator [Bacteroides fragilis]|uniref:hybrid sensor histidine kinase/response regulator n=1 Tax=Bacteroides fragilis TaxID=817 RepID=UPI000FF47AAA|nr:ATP-binding protein [Bacteroides fragilis]MCE9406138.1 response regulator [Bacteroides fragilis]MCE9479844.1 response regulator [Bacteroides fragilis]RHM59334.1 response regulator [Bacteroides fragilis]